MQRLLNPMNVLRTAVAAAAMLALLVIAPSSASAHTDKVYHGDDVAIVTSDHMAGAVCDEERDGHWVVGIFYFPGGGNVALYDGGDASCHKTTFDKAAFKFSICEETKGCYTEYT